MARVDYKHSEITLTVVYFGDDKEAVLSSISDVYKYRYGVDPDFAAEKAMLNQFSKSVAQVFGKKPSNRSAIDSITMTFGDVQGFKLATIIKGIAADAPQDQINSAIRDIDHVVFVVEPEKDGVDALRKLGAALEDGVGLTLQYDKSETAYQASVKTLEQAIDRDEVGPGEGESSVICFKRVLKYMLDSLVDERDEAEPEISRK